MKIFPDLSGETNRNLIEASEGDSETDDYKAPEGGGGVTDNVKVGNKEVSFGHGGRHLIGTGLSANEVNQAIAKDAVEKILEQDNWMLMVSKLSIHHME